MTELQELDAGVAAARRLAALGIPIRSAELQQRDGELRAFKAAEGNRAIRRARKRAQKKRGR